MKTVLITGGCGFVGYNLSVFLKRNGYNVIALDNLTRRGSEINLSLLKKQRIKAIHGDVRNPEDLLFDDKIDIILNTAAEPSAIEGYKNPFFDLSCNTISVFHLLEYARKNKCAFIQWSTNKVYAGSKINAIALKEKETRYEYVDPEYENGIDESFSIDGNNHSIYGLSKAMADLACQEYAEAFGLNIIINRFSCLAGENQWGLPKQGWFAYWPIAIEYGFKVEYVGWKGKQVRDILYIQDLCNLILKQIKSITKYRGEVFNVGGGKENTVSLIEATKMLEKMTGKRLKTSHVETPRRSDQCVYISDISKVSKEFNWKPMVNPESAMKNIHKWVIDNKQLLDTIYK